MSPAFAFEIRPFGGKSVPLLVQAPGCVDLEAALPDLRPLIDEHLPRAGGLLFRGFELAGIDGFRRFAAGFGHPLLSYEFGSTPRTGLGGGVYTSTEYPPHQAIPLHNEQAYTREWPMKIWFYCQVAPEEGGETPIADSRALFRRIDPAIRARFRELGVMYVRNYGNGLDVPWTQVFNTRDRAQVEAFCGAHGIACEWKPDGELRTRQVCQGVARHPVTHDWVWFNQAHLFHTSNLAPEVRESLLAVVDEEDLPRNAYWGDGRPFEDAVLDEIRAVMREEQVVFPWVAGDVLMLDNMLTAHARAPFRGARRIVVAMAEPCSDEAFRDPAACRTTQPESHHANP
jgi:alpha-ketoglutarate-dependent taurine dioxygenase